MLTATNTSYTQSVWRTEEGINCANLREGNVPLNLFFQGGRRAGRPVKRSREQLTLDRPIYRPSRLSKAVGGASFETERPPRKVRDVSGHPRAPAPAAPGPSTPQLGFASPTNARGFVASLF
ncbi:hypothetical protein EVAR_48300_1 [Eumeta japonica]|uniref:Uncharacterized protein n=1 Tax=Eumeta variegata TaxID=151549 RepID=A0A4C1WNH9_EUMVA|nr:hypothetical protein EVAR_48300_1 [Eumeta japonica]